MPVFASQSQSDFKPKTPLSKLCGVAAAAAVLLSGGSAHAVKVADWSASGLIFKDSVELLALDDKEGGR